MKTKISILLSGLLSNTFMYRLYFHLYRSRRGDPVSLPKSTDDFFFDGYPRSGNTYVINLIRNVYIDNNLMYSSHLHSIAGLKIALHKKLKPLVIIRHPKDAIASYYFMLLPGDDLLNASLIKRLIHKYISYYQYIYKERARIRIVQFDQVVNNETFFLKETAKWLKLSELADRTIKTKIIAYKDLMKEKENKKEMRGSSLPNKSRSEHTDTIKKQLEAHSDYRDALGIYQKIAGYLSQS
jgi:hypothetical protein